VAETAPQQLAMLRWVGWEPTVFGDPGRALDAPSIQSAVAAAASDPRVGVVVLATGSNDNVVNASTADRVGDASALAVYAATLNRTLALLGDRCVVLVDVRDDSNELYRTSWAGRTNAELHRVAVTRPATVVVGWADRSRPHPEWFGADRLHFVDATTTHENGMVNYAAAILDGVARCRP